MMRQNSQLSSEAQELKTLLSHFAELRDEIVIEQNSLAHQQIDTSPFGNTDPSVLLRGLLGLIDAYPKYRKWGRLGSFMIPSEHSMYFNCSVNGKPARSYESLLLIRRKFQQDIRLKELSVGVSDFFRQRGISVGKDNVLDVIATAERELIEGIKPKVDNSATEAKARPEIKKKKRVPNPAKRPEHRRPARSKVKVGR